MTARDLIQSVYRLIGVLAVGQTMSGDRAQVGLDALNQMLDAWNVDGLTLYSTTTSVIPTVAAQSTYTIGPTGDQVVAVRPTHLISAMYRDSASSPASNSILTILTAADYTLISSKLTDNSIPMFLYYEPSFPNGSMTLFPVPSEPKQLVIQYLAPHSTALTLNSTISFPPAYTMAIRFNLALILAMEAGRQDISPSIVQQAYETKTLIERANLRVPTLSYDIGYAEYDINSDSVRGA
jgi:hypothetical protein